MIFLMLTIVYRSYFEKLQMQRKYVLSDIGSVIYEKKKQHKNIVPILVKWIKFVLNL